MRMLALGLAAAALALPVGSAAAEPTCAGPYHAQVCVDYECYSHYCIQIPSVVYTDCRHPLPESCDRSVSLKAIGTK